MTGTCFQNLESPPNYLTNLKKDLRVAGLRQSWVTFGGLVMSSLFHLSAKEINSCLRYIAELRVQGKEWEEIAQELQRPVNEVRRFVHQHEEVFRLCMKKAHQDQ